MPMPAGHAKQLEEMSQTVNAFAKLTGDPTYKAIGQVLRQPKLRSTVESFHDKPEYRRAAVRNTTAYFRKQGVNVPRGMTIHLIDNNWRVGLCIKIKVLGVDADVGFHYDSQSGWGWGC